MNTYDASVILNLHKEGMLLKRTLISLDNAASEFVSRGGTIELVAVLDNADNITKNIMNSFVANGFSSVNIIYVSNGSLGLSRNDGISASNGTYIFTADGDDLVSDNYFYEFINSSKKFDKNTVFFPEVYFAFGVNYHIGFYQNLADSTPLSFLENHPYVSRLFGHRDIFDSIKFSDVRLTKGYAFEDWHYNCELVSRGINLEVAPNTIIFYRQREGSLLNEANALSTKQIPPSSLFQPDNFMRICEQHRMGAGKTNRHAQLSKKYDLSNDESFIASQILKANKIDYEISLNNFKKCHTFTNATLPNSLGEAYYDICALIKDLDFSDVFLLPYISNGGAEKYINEILWSLYRTHPERNILLLLGENYTDPKMHNKLPPSVICLDLNLLYPDVSIDRRLLLVVKMLQNLKDGSRIHVRQSVFGVRFLERYSNLFDNLVVTFYRFCDEMVFLNDRLVTTYSSLNLISNKLNFIDQIVTDNETIIANDEDILGDLHGKWHFLPAPISLGVASGRVLDRKNKKILWASRLDHQKRVDLLPSISANVKNRNFTIDVYGEVVIGGFDLQTLNVDGLSYCGKFQGLTSLDLDKYKYFMYTSHYDGVPNILLEAMASGMVVIAPNVGGVAEIIKHMETGILLDSVADNKEMAKKYSDAIFYLDKNPSVVKVLIANAKKLLKERHSYEKYDKRVSELFPVNWTHNSEVGKTELASLENLRLKKKIHLLQKEVDLLYMDNSTTRTSSNKGVNVIGHEKFLWPQGSRAHQLAHLYTQTAHGANFVVKMWRFNRALLSTVKRRQFKSDK